MSDLKAMAESSLVMLAKLKDKAAFTELVSRRQSALRQFLRRLSGNTELADEVAQEVFLQVWLKLPSLQKSNAFTGWLYQIAINMWKQQVRKKDPLQFSETDETEIMIKSCDENTSLSVDLDRALLQIKAPVRLCLVLAYHEGMTHDAIVEFTQLPLGTVKSHIKRGSEKVKNILADYKQANGKQSEKLSSENITDAT